MNRWFILPGMGASAAMYNALKHKVDFEINFLNWPVYRGEKTYSEVARRVVSDYNINDGDIVGGSSLGGMVALEIADIINPEAIILLGSAVSSKEVQNLLSLLSPLASITPISDVQLLVGKNKNLVSSMFADSDTEFIRAMCQHLNSWSGYRGSLEKVFRLHGRKDLIIPCPASGCDVVEDAGHLLAITHAQETASFLEKTRKELTHRSSPAL